MEIKETVSKEVHRKSERLKVKRETGSQRESGCQEKQEVREPGNHEGDRKSEREGNDVRK